MEADGARSEPAQSSRKEWRSMRQLHHAASFSLSGRTQVQAKREVDFLWTTQEKNIEWSGVRLQSKYRCMRQNQQKDETARNMRGSAR